MNRYSGAGPGHCGGWQVGQMATSAAMAGDAAEAASSLFSSQARLARWARVSIASCTALISACVMVGCGSGEGTDGRPSEREARLRAVDAASDSAHARGDVEGAEAVLARALALDSAAVGREAGEHGESPADSVAAWLAFKLGVARLTLGDRSGSLRAFSGLWVYGRAPLPDSLHAEAMRATVYVVSERADMERAATRGDTLRWIGVLDRAEVAARAAGENVLAARIIECRMLLLLGVGNGPRVVHAAACGPDCVRPSDPGTMSLWLLAALVAAVLGGAAAFGTWLGERLHGEAETDG